ncbi:Chromatin structure remodeling complex protein sfh1 [Basidiobolus ranarum]|uniref:Chromatin structure remodeling complex protein sfh1 n=1 Tax=Basidiobolus ranarum TaxID=34480 RepID=A0ABR2W0C7_9FUNG
MSSDSDRILRSRISRPESSTPTPARNASFTGLTQGSSQNSVYMSQAPNYQTLFSNSPFNTTPSYQHSPTTMNSISTSHPNLTPRSTTHFIPYSATPTLSVNHSNTFKLNKTSQHPIMTPGHIPRMIFPVATPAIATLGSNLQGGYSTYASRLREGGSSLIVPANLGKRVLRDKDEDSEEEDFRTPISSSASKVWSRKRLQRRCLSFTTAQLQEAAQAEETLVPIRLDLDIDYHHKLRDLFLWNLNETLFTPEKFAEILCDELDISASVHGSNIVNSIKTQIQHFKTVLDLDIPTEDARVVINLDLHVGQTHLKDQFEWDIYSGLSPTDFARQLASDLALGGEFVSLIAFTIHEQLYRYRQERLSYADEMEYSDMTTPLTSAFRSMEEAEDWAPKLESLSMEELERILMDNERSIRRLRRDASRFVINRPLDSKPNSTSRTSSPLPKSKTRLSEYKTSRLPVEELETWQCLHCGIDGKNTPLVRRGPDGSKTLCNACGLAWQTRGKLPENRLNMYRS